MLRKWKPLIVVIVGLGFGALSELFPLWQYLDGNTSATRSAGYHFYKSPPPLKSPQQMRELFHRDESVFPLSLHVRRAYLQVLAQRLVLLWLTTIGFILSFGRGALLLRVLFWTLFGFGGVVAVLLIWRVVW